MYNVSEVIIRNIDLKKNKKPELEYDYKSNFSSAVTNIRLYLRKKIKMKGTDSENKKISGRAKTRKIV